MRWKPGQSGNPGGRPAISEYARNVVRRFFLDEGGMEEWIALTRDARPYIRAMVFKDLARFAFGWPAQEIRVERHASTVSLHVAAVANPEKYAALEEARAKVQALLLDGKEAGNGSGRDADG
jgi:hypothetical protein